MIELERLRHVAPATYQAHFIHGDDRLWPETNCYIDLWTELIHALGLNPVAGLVSTLSAGFNGEQWDMFKYSLDDLWTLYGIMATELNVWLPIDEHLADHLALGNLLAFDADSWFLPDTAGTAYQRIHQKTTIAPIRLDRQSNSMTYFHNRGVHEVSGSDVVGVLKLDKPDEELPAYCEVVELDRVRRHDDDVLRDRVVPLVARSLAKTPATNPVRAMAERIGRDTKTLVAREDAFFHAYAFATLRQCGGWAEVAATFVDWLDPVGLAPAVEALRSLSNTTKTCQFKMARLASGRATDLGPLFDAMSDSWDQAYDVMCNSAWARPH